MRDPKATSLDGAVEWGGRAWRSQVVRGLRWLGPVNGLRVLDLGTRFGGMAIHFARAGATVVGVDIDGAALEIARRRAVQAGVGHRTSFEERTGDPEDLPRDFDVIFTKSVLVLAPNLGVMIESLATSLRPGGRLLSVENSRGPVLMHGARVVRRRSLSPHGATYFTPGTIALFERCFDVEMVHWTRLPPTVVVGGLRR